MPNFRTKWDAFATRLLLGSGGFLLVIFFFASQADTNKSSQPKSLQSTQMQKAAAQKSAKQKQKLEQMKQKQEERKIMAQVEAEQAREQAITKSIKSYLRDGFGFPGEETTWYKSIKNVSVIEETVYVRTDLMAFETETFSGVCSGVSGFVYANPNSHWGLSEVVVYDAGGTKVIVRKGLGDSCSP